MLPVVEPGATVTAVPVMVNVGGAVTVNVMVPVSVRAPDVPVVVIV